MAILSIACLIPAGISWLGAMSQAHNVGLGVSSVEWLRQNGGNPVVTQIENWYYTLTAPSKGGPPLHSRPGQHCPFDVHVSPSLVHSAACALGIRWTSGSSPI